ncbi:scavenger receptor cysteine-rich domain superfamily protein-like [Mercenaria mercenaria]|uniref:scavenger receptor cysteine-rich domain superfamily protein-like n=1 Tax=Mercenaria mercenaria TaxID=6596 RepID=UPI00234F6151|nr:scavenger receptor cysteine-rich domain superfamily protein-like [Mercenaria mercenaria]
MVPGRTLLLVLIYQLQTLCYSQDTGDVRLFKGNENSIGIVQLYHNNTWTTVCGHTFTDQAAQVTCRQLGFDRGTALPLGAFGDFYHKDIVPYVGQFQECVTGQESKLVDCKFTDVSTCPSSWTAYASVVCKSGQKPQDPDVPVKLDTDRSFPEAGYFSSVQVYESEIWGRVCGLFWDDNDAGVLCRQLGYHDGVATYSSASLTVPLLISEINCVGNETNLSSCPQANSICYGNRSAAVVCYQKENQGPSLSLVGGKANYGKVVLSIDGQSGLICNTSNYNNISVPWGYKEASAVCRQLGYTSGGVLQEQYETGAVKSVVLDGVSCLSGEEESLLRCRHGGWGDVSTQCMDEAFGVSVYCYSEVRLAGSGVLETEQLYFGRVEMYDAGLFYGVCANAFSPTVAMVTCRQFGFAQAEIMLPGSFGSSFQKYTSISNITCNGDEDRIANCTYSLGQCEGDNTLHAALLCKQPSTPDSYTFSLSENYYGDVLVKRYGITGHVCREGWDDNDAKVMCKKAGYASGIRLNTYNFVRDTPFWSSNFSCNGLETSLADCGYQTDMSTDWYCANDKVSAGVLCFLDEPPEKLVRLADGISDEHGRAEVFNDVTRWATICDRSWGNNDARVFCRQAGFADGQVHT